MAWFLFQSLGGLNAPPHPLNCSLPSPSVRRGSRVPPEVVVGVGGRREERNGARTLSFLLSHFYNPQVAAPW